VEATEVSARTRVQIGVLIRLCGTSSAWYDDRKRGPRAYPRLFCWTGSPDELRR